MKIIHIVLLGSLLASCFCNQNTPNLSSSNPKKLDSNLRKALLKALTELENEGATNTSILKNNDSIEKAPASAISFFQRDNTPIPTETTTQTPEEVQKQIVVVQKSNGLQHRPITSFIPANVSENFLTSASNNYNFPRNRIVGENSKTTNNKIEDLTSPSPTAETPTTEENEATAEEVQFFSAPLVAAFTVHQDERGLPKSVEPIYKQSKDIASNFVQKGVIRQQQLKNEHLQTQVDLHEKHRLLEEQLYTLQRQQKEQEVFLYRQQQLIQEQQRRLLEQNKIDRNKVNFASNQNQIDSANSFGQTTNHLGEARPIIHNKIIPSSNQFNHPTEVKSTILFQNSVSLTPEQLNRANELPLNAQHLPNKSFNDFKRTPYIQDILDQTLLPPHQTDFHHVNFDHPQINNQQPPNTRIYRQEPSTGNFYNNNINDSPHTRLHSPNYIIQPSVPLNLRYLRSNSEAYQTSTGFPSAQPPVIKQHLSSLLHNSGIHTGRHEDLDLISKILSYNHVGGNTRFYNAIH